MGAAGKRAGARRGPKKRSLPSRRALLLCLGVTLCVVAWGYLVKAAIDFGTSARGGESQAWAFLGLACLGAAACLFVGLILIGKLLRAAGIIAAPAPVEPQQTPPTRSGTAAASPSAGEERAVPTQVLRPVEEAPAVGDETAPLPAVPQARTEPPTVSSRSVPTPRHGGGKRAAR